MKLAPFFVRVLNKLRWLPLFNLRSTIVVNERKIAIPILGQLGYPNLHLSEPWMTEIFKRLKPFFNGHFVDVGVNIGQTLVKVHAVFGQVDYIGLEPNPSCVHYVQELVRINGLKGYRLFPIGVGAKTDVLKLNFFASDNSDSSASIIEHYRPGAKEDHFIYVPIFDFHAIRHFLPTGDLTIVKIDVEGAELEVLLGLLEWVKESTPLILLEILPVYSPENEDRLKRQDMIEGLMNSLNYKMARIKKSETVSIDPISAIGIHSVIEDCDYLMYPAQVEERLLDCFKA
jgi:FkbM family methyltransferase